ncbi:MAG: DUF3501 family protein [Gemmataceae bacterium]|nr:DUF3501 family protein [Gemmataceae bacterium]MDW8265677.1 DUF3501 family protein [Gemmataceae bacterium]
MCPLTIDDLLPLSEYVGRRREFFDAQARYLDRYRRVRVGPKLTLRFENRQTVWFYVQELIRVARLTDPELIQRELEIYNRLLPQPDELQATLIIEAADEAKWAEELAAWQELTGDAIRLLLGDASYPARIVTCRLEDRCFGAAQWVQFPLDATGRQLLADFAQPALLEVAHGDYQQRSAPLSEDMRQSLLEDLQLSDRAAAAAA